MESVSNNYVILHRFVNRKIDNLIIHKDKRWYAYAGVLAFFILRMILLQGYFAIAYFLGFYTLQNVILYMTPSGIPSITDVRLLYSFSFSFAVGAFPRFLLHIKLWCSFFLNTKAACAYSGRY